MKKIAFFVLFLAGTLKSEGQTMKWVSIPQGTAAGKCVCAASTKNNYMCYALEYIPAVTGTLTSYTTGFFVSCTSVGSPVAKNLSCSMTDNAKVINGCSDSKKILLNSSGNSGNALNSQIVAGKPVYLHQVCFVLPEGESITIEEEELTDLTTSVDLGAGQVATEYPAFEKQVISKPRYDDALPTSWLDFKAVRAGEQVSQLDWTIKTDQPVSGFAIERSVDGTNFEKIGELQAPDGVLKVNSFQYLDHHAGMGKNYYRIHLYDRWGKSDDSPVRWVSFEDLPFSVSVTPNPASDYLLVDIHGRKNAYEISLFDAQGQRIMLEKPEFSNVQTRLNIESLRSGVYTVQVKSGEDTYTEKISVIER